MDTRFASPFPPPSPEHLWKARDAFLQDSNLSADHPKIEAIIDPLMKAGHFHLVIAFWIWYLESKRPAPSASAEAKTNPALAMAHFALKLNPERPVIDPQTRLMYLEQFSNYIKGIPGQRLTHELTLFFISGLIFEMDFIDPPAAAIRQFGQIPVLREAEKKKEKEANQGLLAWTKEKTKNLLFNRGAERKRQLTFIRIVHQLIDSLEKSQPPLYLEDLLKGFAFWIMHEIERDFDTNTSSSTLKTVLESLYGYSHTTEVDLNIVKLRIDQLLNFLSDINDTQWRKAARTICDDREFKQCSERYFRSYDSLNKLKILRNTPRSTRIAVGMGIGKGAYNLSVTAAYWCVPSVATKMYSALKLETVASGLGLKFAEYLGDHVENSMGRTIRWIIETPVAWTSGAIVGGGVQSGMEAVLLKGVNRGLGVTVDGPAKEDPELVEPPKILFVDFLTLALEAAKQSRQLSRCAVLEAVLRIFPELPRAVKQTFDQQVPAWYFIPGRPKGPCPFRVEIMPAPKAEPACVPPAEVKEVLVTLPSPEPADRPTPTAPNLAAEDLKALSPLRAKSLIQPEINDDDDDDDDIVEPGWVVCGEPNPSPAARKIISI